MFMARLLGFLRPPRQRHAVYAFMDENWDSGMNLKARADAAWNARPGHATAPQDVNFRFKIIRDMFKTLDKETQQRYQDEVKVAGDKAKAEYQATIAAGPQTDPVSRAAAVSNVKKFLFDVNKGVEERTFLRTFRIFGGPMGQYDGKIGTFNISVSQNNDAVPLTFAEWWGQEKLSAFVDDFKLYLATCYTEAQRNEVILPEVSSLRKKNTIQLDITANSTAPNNGPEDELSNADTMDDGPPDTSKLIAFDEKSSPEPASDNSLPKDASAKQAQAQKPGKSTSNSSSQPSQIAKDNSSRVLDSDSDDSDDDNPRPWDDSWNSEGGLSDDSESDDAESGSDDDIVPKKKLKTTKKKAAADKENVVPAPQQPKLSQYERDRNAKIRANRLALAGMDYTQKKLPLGTQLPTLDAQAWTKIALEAIEKGEMDDLVEKDDYEVTVTKPRPKPRPTFKALAIERRTSSRLAGQGAVPNGGGESEGSSAASNMAREEGVETVKASMAEDVRMESADGGSAIPAAPAKDGSSNMAREEGVETVKASMAEDVRMESADGSSAILAAPAKDGSSNMARKEGVETEKVIMAEDVDMESVDGSSAIPAPAKDTQPIVTAAVQAMSPSPNMPPPPQKAASDTQLFDTARYAELRKAAPDWLAAALNEFDVANGAEKLRDSFLWLLEIEDEYKSRMPKEKRLPAQKRPHCCRIGLTVGGLVVLSARSCRRKTFPNLSWHSTAGGTQCSRPGARATEKEVGKWECQLPFPYNYGSEEVFGKIFPSDWQRDFPDPVSEAEVENDLTKGINEDVDVELEGSDTGNDFGKNEYSEESEVEDSTDSTRSSDSVDEEDSQTDELEYEDC
ncbi:hypothetical protein BDZ89DRAFT_1139737 [Hymenopellis radicata]|nr:hypothetical protein BDZ89DRAFT_1139737 [Hymenopellis radicata]